MIEKNITVVIPTYNRFECIKHLIDNCILAYNGVLFNFQIHDSSSSSDTENYVKEVGQNISLQYFKYDPAIIGDIKTMTAIKNVQSEYFYLLGDGVLIDFNKLEKYLLSIEYDKYSVIGFRGINEINKKVQNKITKKNKDNFIVCNDCTEYFKNYFWLLTLYGASIVKRNVLDISQENIGKYIEMKSPFMYICSLFEGISVNTGSYSFSFVDFITPNPYKKDSGWMANKSAIEFFCYKYFISVQKLPSVLNAQNRKFLISHNKYSGLFSFKGILRLRLNGNITRGKISEYRKYINKTVPFPKVLMIYNSILIPRKLLLLVKKLIHKS